MAGSDYRQILTDKLIEQLEAGTAPWQKPWDAKEGSHRLPYNPITDKPYRGANSLYLTAVGAGKGYTDPRWATYKQAAAQGWQVQKGEKGALVEYWKFSEEKPELDAAGKPVLGEDGQPKTVHVMLEKPQVFRAVVFNAQQMDGVPELSKAPRLYEWNPNERAEAILQSSGARIYHDQPDRAFYSPSRDEIHLPGKDQFKDQSAYYSTALHELGHWTGHESRLGRDMGNSFGSIEYAKEELRAELSSYFMADKLGVPHEPGQHAAYVKSWVKVLQEDKNEIFRAARDAEKITEYVLALDRQRELERGQERDLGGREAGERGAAQEAARLRPHDIPPQGTPEYAQLLRTSIAERNESNSYGQLHAEAQRQFGESIQFGMWAGNDPLKGQVIAETRHSFAVKADQHQQVVVLHKLEFRELPEVGQTVMIGEHQPGIGRSIALAAPDREPAAERTVLQVPYREKEQAKALGAKWDKGAQEWYAPKGTDLAPLKQWMPQEGQQKSATQERGEPSQAPAAEPAKERTALQVPFMQKTEAKALGAKWDKDAKAWYAPEGADLAKLARWIPKEGPDLPAVAGGSTPREEPKQAAPSLEASATDIDPALRAELQALRDVTAQINRQPSSPVQLSTDAKPMPEKAVAPAVPAAAPELEPGQPPAPARTWLAVPFSDKGLARNAGAKWDTDAKSWYAPPDADMAKLERWKPENVKIDKGPVVNPREEFAAEMSKHGLFVGRNREGDHPIMDGKPHRVPVKGGKDGSQDGFYIGGLDGRPAGRIINNKTGVDVKWVSEGQGISEEELAKIRAESAEKSAQKAVEQERTHEASAQRISRQLAQLEPVQQPTPYMQAKGIEPAVGVLTDHSGKTTYIPAMDADGKVWTAQYIQEDGTKRFAKDARKEGSFHPIGGMDALAAAPVLVIAEGYATAKTTSQALGGMSTVAAFDSGNLEAVAKALHAKYPEKPIIIAGDDDRHLLMTLGKNPGRDKAEAAAVAVGGQAVFPEFKPQDNTYPQDLPKITPNRYKAHLDATEALADMSAGKIDLSEADIAKAKALTFSEAQMAALSTMKRHTDFNDLQRSDGLGVVKEQLDAALAQAMEKSHQQATGIAKTQLGNDIDVKAPGQNTRHTGEVLGVTGYHAAQATGRNAAVVHTVADLDKRPEPGKVATIQYRDGRGHVEERRIEPAKEKALQR